MPATLTPIQSAWWGPGPLSSADIFALRFISANGVFSLAAPFLAYHLYSGPAPQHRSAWVRDGGSGDPRYKFPATLSHTIRCRPALYHSTASTDSLRVPGIDLGSALQQHCTARQQHDYSSSTTTLQPCTNTSAATRLYQYDCSSVAAPEQQQCNSCWLAVGDLASLGCSTN